MNQAKILQAIEDICADDFCEDLEMRQHAGEISESATTAAEKLAAIYRIAHSHNTSHSCYPVHDDWRKSTGARATRCQTRLRRWKS